MGVNRVEKIQEAREIFPAPGTDVTVIIVIFFSFAVFCDFFDDYFFLWNVFLRFFELAKERHLYKYIKDVRNEKRRREISSCEPKRQDKVRAASTSGWSLNYSSLKGPLYLS